MPALITHHYRIHQAQQFLESFSETNPTRYYYFIGKSYAVANAIPITGTVKLRSYSNTIIGKGTLFNSELNVGDIIRTTANATQASAVLRVHQILTPQTFVSTVRPTITTTSWGSNAYIRKSYNEDNPPAPLDRYQDTYYDIWRNIIATKRIQPSDVTHGAPRYNWTSGTVYTEYDDQDPNLMDKAYYVMTLPGDVYKCIDNNYGTPSTIRPTGNSTEITYTADGYRWKYMYTVESGRAIKFLTTDYIPVKTLTENDSSAQWAVQTDAANGAIHHIKLIANGSGYSGATGKFYNVRSSTAFNLELNTSSSIDGEYTGSSIYIDSGLGSGQEPRKIIKYYGVHPSYGNNYCIVNTAFTTTPNANSTYIISPTINILGDSGGTINSRATAYASEMYNGQIRKITVINQGRSYSTANVSITANSIHGYGAVARVIISPLGGHGKDPVDELYGKDIIMSARVAGAESNTFPTNNDFRLVGVLRDPLLANGSPATTLAIDQTTRISVDEVSGDFFADEIIVGKTTGAKARLVYFANTNAARTDGVLKVIRVTTNGTGASFARGEIVQGSLSTRTANVQLVTPGALKKYSGLVIYTENRAPVTRSFDQTEDVKVIINF